MDLLINFYRRLSKEKFLFETSKFPLTICYVKNQFRHVTFKMSSFNIQDDDFDPAQEDDFDPGLDFSAIREDDDGDDLGLSETQAISLKPEKKSEDRESTEKGNFHVKIIQKIFRC